MRVDLLASSFHLHSRSGHITKFNLLKYIHNSFIIILEILGPVIAPI